MIELQGVSFSYDPEATVLDAVDLTLEGGGLTALLGPNGSGKSTLLAVALGFLKPISGQVLVSGEPLDSFDRPSLGKLMGFVSQTAALPFNYSVFDYVLLGRAAGKAGWEQPGGRDFAHVDAALEQAGIIHLRTRNVQELSAGELQLVAIARGLCQGPKVLLLDEPTSHLDPAHSVMVFRLLRRLVTDGMTVFMTTHDPLHARQVADRAVLLKDGSVKADGGVATVLTAEILGKLYGVSFFELARDGHSYPLTEV